MAAPTLTRPAATTQAPAAGGTGKAPAVAPVPFTRAARRKSILSFDTGNVQLGAAATQIAPVQIPPAGYLRYIELSVTITAAGNSAAVAFAADGPWNALSYVSMANSSGDTIIVPITGYQLMLINKYGALGEDAPYCDPRNPNAGGFSTVTGTAATGGSATFALRLPAELDPRDAFCALPNMAANKAYALQLQFNPTSTIYTTAPTAAPTIRVVGIAHFWTQPSDINAAGNPQQSAPFGNGSVSLWRVQTIAQTAGDKLNQLTNVGNVIRMAIVTLRTAAGARTSADLPATWQWIVNNDTMFYLPTGVWQGDVATSYGYTAAGFDAVGTLDSGVLPLHYFMEMRGRVLADGPRDQWLPTLDATLLQLRGTSYGAGAATLEIITNEIKPLSASALYSPNLS